MYSPKLTKDIPKLIVWIILVVGILIRITYQFYDPSFNLDEINLGTNIKEISLGELFKPPKNFQSAPPLFLLIQWILIKILPFSFWINIKMFPTLCSIINLILFSRLIRNYDHAYIAIFMLILFALNPYIIYNTLTVKQYTVDLLGILILTNYIDNIRFKRKIGLFFVIYILFSNVGLLACTGLLLYRLIYFKINSNSPSFLGFIKTNYQLLLAPIPYIIFFIWYRFQEGYLEQYNYMSGVWDGSFLTFNFDGLKQLFTIIHIGYTHIFSIYEIWGIFLSVIMCVGLIILIRRKHLVTHGIIILGICIFFIHIILNSIRLYPMVERTLLYMSPFLIITLGLSLKVILKQSILKSYKRPILIVISLISLVLYSSYSPQKKNNVPALYKLLDRYSCQEVYITNRAHERIKKFNDFTDDKFKKEVIFISPDSTLDKSDYIIGWVHKKLDFQEYYNNEGAIENLKRKKKISYLDMADSFNLFKVNH